MADPGLTLDALIANPGSNKHLVLGLQVSCVEVEDWEHSVALPGFSKDHLWNSLEPLEVQGGDRLQGPAEGPA